MKNGIKRKNERKWRTKGLHERKSNVENSKTTRDWQAESERSTHLELSFQVILEGKNSRKMRQGRHPRMQSTKSKYITNSVYF